MGRCVILRLSWKTPAASIYVFSRKFLAPAGKKKKRNFNHRLGACYNLGIYIYMLKVFLLICTPSSQLFSALEQLRLDEKVRVVVFKSEVKGVFCAGK